MRPQILRHVSAALAHTWRIEVSGEDHVRRLRDHGTPIVFAVWHGQMLAPLWHRRGEGITLMVSGHTDGSYLSGAAMQWGYNVIRGSSTRGAVSAMRGILRVLARGGDVAFAPDGPRGPAQTAKPGALAVAIRGRAAIVPVSASAASSWTLRSWDRFMIPRPFARVRIAYGEPLRIDGGRPKPHAALLDDLLATLGSAARC